MTETLTTALERSAQEPHAKTIRDLIDRMAPELEKTLPRSIGVERFTRTVLTELRRTPKLYDCSPQSVLGAMMLAAQLGLEPGPLGHVYLVPFKGEAAFIVGYRGMIELAYRSGQVKDVTTGTVRAGDSFAYRAGTRPFLDHTPAGPPDEREPIAYYAVARLRSGGAPFRVMYPDDVEAIRKRSPSARSDLSPWTTDYRAMAEKSCVRQLARFLPSTPALATALERDDAPAPPLLDVGDALDVAPDDSGPDAKGES